MPRKVIDWEAIKVEWDLGQLDVAEIARQHEITPGAIHNRASRKGWSPRPEKSAVVTGVVTAITRDDNLVTNSPRLAIAAFHRVIMLLLRHRAFLGRLSDELARCFDDIDRIRQGYADRGQMMRLDEVETITNIATKAAMAMSKLVPLERRAFGLTDQDGPSELDAFTPEQMEAVENTVRKALGMPPAQTAITVEAEDVEIEEE
jgi:hypothetical protein